MFTFSFGSAFAATNFNGTTYPAMQAGDYYVGGTVTNGTAGAMGITDAERDAYVATLEAALETLDDDAEYLSNEYCGAHLTNVTNYVKEALEAAKVAATSVALKQVKDDLATKVATEKTKAQLISALEGEYNVASSDASFKLTLSLAQGTYLLPGYAYYTTAADNVEVIKDGGSAITETDALTWMLDNGYETKAQIESTAAKAAFEKAVVKVSGKADGKTVYTASVGDLTPDFVAAYYEWEGLKSKLAQTAITDLDATVDVNKKMAEFESKYGTPAVATDRATRVTAAHNYYKAVTFEKEYDAIKDLKSSEYVANKDKIVKFAQDVAAYEDKYGVTTSYNLTAELTAIENAGDDALVAAARPFSAAESVLASQKDAVDAYAKAYDGYKAEFKDAIYGGFGSTLAVTTDITKENEAMIKALTANIAQLSKDDAKDDAIVQALLNNATVKVTTKALGSKKVRVQATVDTVSFEKILNAMEDGCKVEYQFYYKKAANTTYKAGKVKDVNYTTFKLAKGVKYNFQCKVVFKDADGNVVATKDYKGSTVGTRTVK